MSVTNPELSVQSFSYDAEVVAVQQQPSLAVEPAYFVTFFHTVEAVQSAASPEQEPPAGIQIEIEYGDGAYAATDSATGIFGGGATLAAALADLGQALLDHRDMLERRPALSPGLQDQLRYLRQRLVRAE